MALNNGGTFWTAPPNKDPKRAYRFRVQFGTSGYLWYAKKATKPTITMTETSHKYLNHTYYWPAKTEWNEIDIVLVDPVEPDVTGDLISSLVQAGFKIPGGVNNIPEDFATPSKKGFVDGLADGGKIIIEQIDEEGLVLERWTLWHAWIKELNFGELDYESENLSEITVKLRYDWAQFDSREGEVQNVFLPS